METQVNRTASLLILGMALVAGCGKDKDYTGLFHARHDANQRFETSVKGSRQPMSTFIETGSGGYAIVIAADPHAGGTVNFEEVINRASKPGIAALIIAGDITTGKSSDYEHVAEILAQAAPLRYYMVIGNHDLYFNGWESFNRLFGPSVYTFVVSTPGGSDLYLCLDTGGGTLGDLQLAWLRALLEKERNNYRHCLVVTHCNFFRKEMTESTNPLVEEICVLLQLFSDFRVDMVVTGHDHHRNEQCFGGTNYITLDAIIDGTDNPAYLLITVNDGVIGYEFKQL
jgi:3',5'-cyclic AMP phosphodiesterase CpdA